METDESGAGHRPAARLPATVHRALRRSASAAERLLERLRSDGAATTAGVVARVLRRRVRERVYLPLLRARSSDGLVRRDVDGRTMYLRLDDTGLARRLLVRGEHEPGVEELWTDALEPGMEVVDVGSNVGYYALQAAEAVGDAGHVHAIEPVPENHELLRRNVAANGLDNVTTYDVAVGASVDTERMHLTDASNWGTLLDWDDDERASAYMVEKMEAETRDVLEVETTTLSAFVEEHDVASLDAFRMDVEGYEVEITEGATDLLAAADSPCWAFLELHNKLFDDHERVVGDLLDTYADCGFRPHALLLGNDPVDVEVDDDEDEAAAFRDAVLALEDACPHVVLKK